jgi:NADH dehydrogenase FAD-containing subunit
VRPSSADLPGVNRRSMTPHVLVLGSGFGGLTAALALRAELGDEAAVTVVSPSDRFVFTPSLTWLPFGRRALDDLSFRVDPTLDAHRVHFVHASATAIDPARKTVTISNGTTYGYDYLVLATGHRDDVATVPGIGEDGHASTITTVHEAFAAGRAWRRFLDEPGDVVVGATQGAGCFGAAYEFLFNTAYQLKRRGLDHRVRLTYVTAEPFLGHFGIGGLPHGEQILGTFARHAGIEVVTGVAMEEVYDRRVRLMDGRDVPFSWAMVVPAFRGEQVVAETPGLADEKGFVPVRDTHQSKAYDDVYAVGVAAAVDVPWATAVPVGVPRTGFAPEAQAHVAAADIAAQVRGEEPGRQQELGDSPEVCIVDAGSNGVVMLTDRMVPPRKHGVLIPGPQSHLFKLAFEKYFLWKVRNGLVDLP